MISTAKQAVETQTSFDATSLIEGKNAFDILDYVNKEMILIM